MEELKENIQHLFKLNEKEGTALSNLFSEIKYEKYSFFASTGEYSKKMAFVKSGILRAYFQKENGEQYNKTFFKIGDFVGAYSSLVTGMKNLIDIQCLTTCELLIADYHSFRALFDDFPKIERIARITAEQYFVQKEKREIELVTLEAKDRYRIFKEEYPELEQQIPQYHIASYLAVSPTQLSRIRAQKNKS